MTFLETYQRNKDRVAGFEGFFASYSVSVMTSMLLAQESMGVRGSIVEFGVFRGRSASLLLSHLRPNERAILVDLHKSADLDGLKAINPEFEFVYGRSEELVTTLDFQQTVGHGVRFAHHDASHTYDNLMGELAFMSDRLVPGGLMVLDDFMNANYVQVMAACFDYLGSGQSDLEIVLYASAKAYLCRRADYPRFAHHVRHHLQPEIQGLGFDCFLSRTDDHARYRGFSLVPKTKADQPDLYGLQFNGDRYYTL